MTLSTAIFAFLGLAALIATAGTVLTRAGDRIADLTGLGEALIGGVLLGGISSLSGVMTSVTAAYGGHAHLSFSNAVGGIAAQTVFLAIADLTYRRANLEHASASLSNLMQGILLMLMLTFVLLTLSGPELTLWHIHPSSLLLLGVYVAGTRLVAKARQSPMWKPILTHKTVEDKPDDDLDKVNKPLLFTRFLISAAVVGVAGFFVAKVAIVIADKSGLTQSFVGALFTAVATSLPELVISIAAVRQGALTLAVANIIGGNSFDVLFLAFADVAYTEGSIYHQVGNAEAFVLSLGILLAGTLLLGMLYRQPDGPAKSGWESITAIGLFLGGYIVLYLM